MGRIPIAFVERRPLVALLLLCLIAWLPGFFTLPPLDRDESRFAQASKQMLETGDFLNISLGDRPRYEKPAGIYWLQSASTALLGGGARNAIWTYRVPSLLGALAAVAITFFLARMIAGPKAAFFSGLVLGVCVLLMAEAKIAKTDAVLLATIVAAQAVLMRAYLSARMPGTIAPPGLKLALGGWAAVGVGILIKGPVAAAIALATATALVLWDREWRWLSRLHPLKGFALALALVIPWAVSIGIASGGEFYQTSLGQDLALKVMGGQETHGGPFGYYTALVSLTFWPGTLLLLPALIHAAMRREEPAMRFLLAWAGATWLIFELAPTKLPHYVLPAYPALAILCGLWLRDAARNSSRGLRAAEYVSLGLFAIAGLALAGFLAWAPQRYGSASWWLFAALLAAVLPLFAVIPQIIARRYFHAVAMACFSAILLYAAAGFLTVPRLPQLWLSPRMAEAVSRHAAQGDPPVVTAGYAEPSILFLLGTETQLDDGLEAGRASASAGGLVLVADDQKEPFLTAVEKGGAHAEALEIIAGLNYSRGQEMRITLYRVAPRLR